MRRLPHHGNISVVVPAYHEALGIANTIGVLKAVLTGNIGDYEIVVVDDGSSDDTFQRVQEIAAKDQRVHGIRLSRNFGKEAALLAGLRAATGDAVITIDADLQHPPALIPDMIRAWHGGAMVVNAVKRDRADAHFFGRWRANLFNKMFSSLSGINLLNASDFKLLDRCVVDIIVQSFPEKMRFYRGLTQWIGFEQASLQFDVDARHTGRSSWSTRALIRFALASLLAFTSAPLRIVTVLGGIALLLGAIVAGDALLSWERGRAVSGFTTLIITLLFLGSSIMVSLGIIGEYIAKAYSELKGRPSYLVASTCGQGGGLRRQPPVPEVSSQGDRLL